MTSQIGRGLAIIVAAALVGVLILSEGYDGLTVAADVESPPAATDGSAADDGAAADDSAPTDDTGAADSATDGAADDSSATDAGTDATADATADDDSGADGSTDGAATDATTDGVTDDSGADAPVTTRPPAEVAVLVTNGSGINGAAGRGVQTLTANGYLVFPPANATVTGTDAIYYAATYEAEAREIARILGGTDEMVLPMPESPPVVDLQGANVLVVLGPELATSG